MSKRTIENCRHKKHGGTETEKDDDGNIRCLGFGKSEEDDEPTDFCKRCKLCASYEKEDAE